MKLRRMLAAMSAAVVAISAVSVSASAAIIDTKTDIISWNAVEIGTGVITEECTLEVKVKDLGENAQFTLKTKEDGWPALDITDHFKTDGSSASFDTTWGVLNMSNDTTKITIDITKDMANRLNTAGGAVSGQNYTLLSVDFVEAAEEPVVTPAPVEDTSVSIGNTINTSLYVMNNADWVTANAGIQKVSKTGEYTYKVDGLSVDPSTLAAVYLKDADVEAKTATTTTMNSDVKVLTKSIKINGKEVALKDGYPTGLNDDGALDIAWYNIWTENYFSVDGVGTINSVEVTVEFVADSAAETPAEPEENETPDEPTVEEPDDIAEPDDVDEPVDEGETEEGETEETEEESVEDYGDVSFVDASDYFDGSTLFIRDEEKGGFADDAGIPLSAIYGVKYYVTFDDAQLADEEFWVGGGTGANSDSTGWAAHEWGKASGEKEITPDFENGTIVWFNDGSIFTEDESFAQLWIQTWGGTVTVDSVEVMVANDVAESTDTDTDTDTDAGETETEADDNKGNPDTGVAGVAVAAGVVALAGAAVVVSRKRK